MVSFGTVVTAVLFSCKPSKPSHVWLCVLVIKEKRDGGALVLSKCKHVRTSRFRRFKKCLLGNNGRGHVSFPLRINVPKIHSQDLRSSCDDF